MDNIMTEFIKDINFGKLQQFGEMAVLPIFSTKNSENYLSLKEAMSKELLEITEIDESGSVPELKVKNNAEIPVLILDGEELVGAKQNRVVNTSILLPEQFELLIPVSCVEQGRWNYTSKNFQDSDRIASYKLRNVKSASVMKSVRDSGIYTSDQDAVWNEVHALETKMELCSPTSAMSDIYEAKENDLMDYIDAFELIENQKGILVFIGGEIMGFDVISNELVYKDLHKKLINSYALDAMVQDSSKNLESDVTVEMTNKFLKKIIKSEQTKNESVGYGFDYRFTSSSFIGSSLIHEDEVIHASFFKSLEIEDEEIDGMARYSQRANFRM
ncbi:ARPP-1 family domain-containing protein [Methanobacterium sp. ACI-7]|uniref:ARPP-1 family domain-containing protein n=1 Tax=unclassified Methanobacterium TaxID=2627676 RepID=UPI0039C301B8